MTPPPPPPSTRHTNACGELDHASISQGLAAREQAPSRRVAASRHTLRRSQQQQPSAACNRTRSSATSAAASTSSCSDPSSSCASGAVAPSARLPAQPPAATPLPGILRSTLKVAATCQGASRQGPAQAAGAATQPISPHQTVCNDSKGVCVVCRQHLPQRPPCQLSRHDSMRTADREDQSQQQQAAHFRPVTRLPSLT